MFSSWRRWKRELTSRLTIMVVPHGTARPRQISFSVPFILFLFVVWTGLTGWASYMASQKFDYWRVKAKTHLLKIKLDYFANQLKNSRAMLDEVKEMDVQLRSLIGLGSHEAIVQSHAPGDYDSGGPTFEDITELQKLMEGRPSKMTFQAISKQIRLLKSEMKKRITSFKQITRQIDKERNIYRHTPNIWPTNGYITSHFGARLSPFGGEEQSHKGTDIAAPSGTPIRATADGIVRLAGWAGGYGKVIVIDHSHGYTTRYGHNRQLLVKRGDRVKRGQIIALMGQTGRATGPHCHYEVWHKTRAVDPRNFMRQLGS